MSDQHSEGDLPIEDRQWLVALREAMREIDLVPTSVLDAARAAYSWRTIDAELAHLTYDSETSEAMAGARSQQAALRAGELTVTMQDGRSFGVVHDEVGCFTIDPKPDGVFRLQLPGEAAVVTDWISL